MSLFRALFPFFSASTEVYLDTGATSQRLALSLTAMQDYYCQYNANVHRGSYTSARLASNKYEDARQVIADFLGSSQASQIVFTSGTTDAINMIASGLNIADLQGSEILLCESEHHANLLPWQRFAKQHNLRIKRIALGDNGTFNEEQYRAALASITENVAILAIAHVSNALGNIYPIADMCKKARQNGVLSVIDGTQAPAHLAIDVSAIDCDFYAISGHKMYAGTGIGALYGKMHWLEKLTPSKLGGEMISSVTWDSYTLQPPPGKFEAGTPNIAGAIGLAAAAQFIATNSKQIIQYEQALSNYLVSKLEPLVKAKKLVVLGNFGVKFKAFENAAQIKTAGQNENEAGSAIALLSFYSPVMHANDIATHLASQNIAVRAGHHCAMPLMQTLSIAACVRVSMGCYTTYQDINAFVHSMYQLFDEPDLVPVNNISRAAKVLVNENASPVSIGEAISQAPDWNAKHRLLLLNSKLLPTLPESLRTSKTQVAGCEARVWLSLLGDEKMTKANDETSIKTNVPIPKALYAYSESKVIRGILALIIEKVNQAPAHELMHIDISHYLKEVGLAHYFSEGRRDGIQQIIHRIKHEYANSVD